MISRAMGKMREVLGGISDSSKVDESEEYDSSVLVIDTSEEETGNEVVTNKEFAMVDKEEEMHFKYEIEKTLKDIKARTSIKQRRLSKKENSVSPSLPPKATTSGGNCARREARNESMQVPRFAEIHRTLGADSKTSHCAEGTNRWDLFAAAMTDGDEEDEENEEDFGPSDHMLIYDFSEKVPKIYLRRREVGGCREREATEDVAPDEPRSRDSENPRTAETIVTHPEDAEPPKETFDSATSNESALQAQEAIASTVETSARSARKISRNVSNSAGNIARGKAEGVEARPASGKATRSLPRRRKSVFLVSNSILLKLIRHKKHPLHRWANLITEENVRNLKRRDRDKLFEIISKLVTVKIYRKRQS